MVLRPIRRSLQARKSEKYTSTLNDDTICYQYGKREKVKGSCVLFTHRSFLESFFSCKFKLERNCVSTAVLH